MPMLRSKSTITTAGFLWLTVLPACGLFSRPSHEDTSPAKSEISLEVESRHWNDIAVYLMNGSQSQRLGTVAGLSTIHLVLPYRQLATGGKVRLRADPVGGEESFTSEDVLVQAGQSIRWTLESDLARSTLALF